MSTTVGDNAIPHDRSATAQPTSQTTKKVWAGTAGAGAGTLAVQLAIAVLNQYVLPVEYQITNEIAGMLVALAGALAAHQMAYRTAPGLDEAVVIKDGKALSARA